MKKKSIKQNNLFTCIHRIGTRVTLGAFGLLLLGACTPRAFGWGITWSDDFTGVNNQPWSGNWSFRYSGNANGEIQTYVNSWANCHIVSDGTGTDGQALRFQAQTDTGTWNGHWYSARIDTNGKHSFDTGTYLEVRCKFPNSGKGYWPAAWCLGTSGGNWPANGEIDIAEEKNGEWENYQTLHMPGWDPGTGPRWVDHSTTTYHRFAWSHWVANLRVSAWRFREVARHTEVKNRNVNRRDKADLQRLKFDQASSRGRSDSFCATQHI